MQSSTSASLISLLAAVSLTSPSQLTEEEQRSAGVAPGLVRLSVGLESIEDIIADLEVGFAAIKQQSGIFRPCNVCYGPKVHNKLRYPSLWAITCLVLMSTGLVTSVTADTEVEHQDLFQLLEARHDSSIINGVARIWDENFQRSVSYIHVVNEFGAKNSNFSAICSSFSDQACSPNSPKTVGVQTVLGICESPTEIGCIESVSYKNSVLALEGLVPVATPKTIRSEETELGIPRGSMTSLWEASNGTRYAVSAIIQSSAKTLNNSWKMAATKVFSLSVVRVKRDYVTAETRAEVRSDTPGTPRLTLYGGVVAPTLEFEDASFFKLIVRVPNDVGGFFYGRLANAIVESSKSSHASTRYVIHGDVSPVYISAAEENADSPNSSARPGTTGYSREKLSSADPAAYTKWQHLIGDRALTTRTLWRAISFGTIDQRCFKSEKEINGLVSSNASFYSPYPPVFNATTGIFEYKVASPHFDENGVKAIGNFSLSLPLSALQCLYGSDTLPGSAEISLNYSDGSPTQVLQQVVTVTGNWANVSVRGFHFSSPVIRTKFKVPYRTTLARGKAVTLRSLARTSSSQRPKWSASGRCKISGSRLVASRVPGTCKVTLKVLNSKKKYVVFLQRNLKVS